MRTITYSRFLERVCPLLGLTRDDLQIEEEAIVNAFFNHAVRRIWEEAPWPVVAPIEERTPDAGGLIDYEQTSETEIGHVFAVYDKDPYNGTERADTVQYALTATGIQTIPADTANVWVWFRKRCPDFHGDAYAAATAYVAGDQVFYSTTGDYYKCVLASTGNAPTNTTYWERLEIPYEFGDYIVYSTYADWLKSDGQDEKSALQRAMADAVLVTELDRLERQQGILPPFIINTHLSAQAT